MRLPVDTSAITFLCAGAPEPVLDFETRQPKADESGETLYSVQLVALADGAADIISVKTAGKPAERSGKEATSRLWGSWLPLGRWGIETALPSGPRASRRPPVAPPEESGREIALGRSDRSRRCSVSRGDRGCLPRADADGRPSG